MICVYVQGAGGTYHRTATVQEGAASGVRAALARLQAKHGNARVAVVDAPTWTAADDTLRRKIRGATIAGTGGHRRRAVNPKRRRRNPDARSSASAAANVRDKARLVIVAAERIGNIPADAAGALLRLASADNAADLAHAAHAVLDNKALAKKATMHAPLERALALLRTVARHANPAKGWAPSKKHCGDMEGGCHAGPNRPGIASTCSCDCVACHNAFLEEAKRGTGWEPRKGNPGGLQYRVKKWAVRDWRVMSAPEGNGHTWTTVSTHTTKGGAQAAKRRLDYPDRQTHPTGPAAGTARVRLRRAVPAGRTVYEVGRTGVVIAGSVLSGGLQVRFDGDRHAYWVPSTAVDFLNPARGSRSVPPAGVWASDIGGGVFVTCEPCHRAAAKDPDNAGVQFWRLPLANLRPDQRVCDICLRSLKPAPARRRRSQPKRNVSAARRRGTRGGRGKRKP